MPVIGLTCWDRRLDTQLADKEPHQLLSRTYTDALIASGAIPILLPAAGAEAVETVLDRIDGLVLTGGGDIDPSRYGQENTDSSDIDRRRDTWELALAVAARRRRMPTLGICRGCQVVNVAAGGDMHQHVWGTNDHVHLLNEDRTHLTTGHHAVELTGALAEIYGRSSRTVNTLHHQAVDRVGDGLAVDARAPDGTIEGLSATDDWPMVAVQWHPERSDLADERPLFDWLVGLSRP